MSKDSIFHFGDRQDVVSEERVQADKGADVNNEGLAAPRESSYIVKGSEKQREFLIQFTATDGGTILEDRVTVKAETEARAEEEVRLEATVLYDLGPMTEFEFYTLPIVGVELAEEEMGEEETGYACWD